MNSGLSPRAVREVEDLLRQHKQEELFLPFADFPWFRSAPVHQVFHLERPQAHHLYWPELDVDLHVDSIRQPEKHPLVASA